MTIRTDASRSARTAGGKTNGPPADHEEFDTKAPLRDTGRVLPAAAQSSIAEAMQPLFALLFGTQLPVCFAFWDGSSLGPTDGPGTVRVRSADAIRRVAWAPGELGVSRAFVAGDLEIEGDTFAVLRALHEGELETFGEWESGWCRSWLWRLVSLVLWIVRPTPLPKRYVRHGAHIPQNKTFGLFRTTMTSGTTSIV